MTETTDGAKYVWAVFNSDGYECSDFCGAFETEAEAVEKASQSETLIRAFYAQWVNREWAGSVKVKSIRLGEFQMPPDAEYMLEKPTPGQEEKR